MRSFAAGLAVTMLVTCSFAADAKPPVVGSAKFPDLKASIWRAASSICRRLSAGAEPRADRFPAGTDEQLDTWPKEMERFQEVDPHSNTTSCRPLTS